MAEETVENRVIKIVSEVLGIDENKIDTQSTYENLGADPEEIKEICNKLKEKFQIEIPKEEMTTPEDTIDYIEGNLVT